MASERKITADVRAFFIDGFLPAYSSLVGQGLTTSRVNQGVSETIITGEFMTASALKRSLNTQDVSFEHPVGSMNRWTDRARPDDDTANSFETALAALRDNTNPLSLNGVRPSDYAIKLSATKHFHTAVLTLEAFVAEEMKKQEQKQESKQGSGMTGGHLSITDSRDAQRKLIAGQLKAYEDFIEEYALMIDDTKTADSPLETRRKKLLHFIPGGQRTTKRIKEMEDILLKLEVMLNQRKLTPEMDLEGGRLLERLKVLRGEDDDDDGDNHHGDTETGVVVTEVAAGDSDGDSSSASDSD